MPTVFADDTPLNYTMMERADDFEVSPHEEKAEAERRGDRRQQEKWGWAG